LRVFTNGSSNKKTKKASLKGAVTETIGPVQSLSLFIREGDLSFKPPKALSESLKNSKAELFWMEQDDITVQIRSHLNNPFRLLVPCVR
jgi:hypothetical protein